MLSVVKYRIFLIEPLVDVIVRGRNTAQCVWPNVDAIAMLNLPFDVGIIANRSAKPFMLVGLKQRDSKARGPSKHCFLR